MPKSKPNAQDSNPHSTPEELIAFCVGMPRGTIFTDPKNSLLKYRVPYIQQSPSAMFPLVKPGDDASEDEWLAYRKEHRRRVVIRAERYGRIQRRESPHDVTACEQCRSSIAAATATRERDVDVNEVARLSMMSRDHVYRVISPNVKDRRGLKTLSSMRRIAHDGLGISLDTLALILELK